MVTVRMNPAPVAINIQKLVSARAEIDSEKADFSKGMTGKTVAQMSKISGIKNIFRLNDKAIKTTSNLKDKRIALATYLGGVESGGKTTGKHISYLRGRAKHFKTAASNSAKEIALLKKEIKRDEKMLKTANKKGSRISEKVKARSRARIGAPIQV